MDKLKTLKRFTSGALVALMLLGSNLAIVSQITALFDVSLANAATPTEQARDARDFLSDSVNGKKMYFFRARQDLFENTTTKMQSITRDATDIIAKSSEVVPANINLRERVTNVAPDFANDTLITVQTPGTINGNNIEKSFSPTWDITTPTDPNITQYIVEKVNFVPKADLAEGSILSSGTVQLSSVDDNISLFPVEYRWHNGFLKVTSVKYFDNATNQEITQFTPNQKIRIEIALDNNGCAPLFDLTINANLTNFTPDNGQQTTFGGNGVRMGHNPNKAGVNCSNGTVPFFQDGNDILDTHTYSIIGVATNATQAIGVDVDANVFIESTGTDNTINSIAATGDDQTPSGQNQLIATPETGTIQVNINGTNGAAAPWSITGSGSYSGTGTQTITAGVGNYIYAPTDITCYTKTTSGALNQILLKDQTITYQTDYTAIPATLNVSADIAGGSWTINSSTGAVATGAGNTPVSYTFPVGQYSVVYNGSSTPGYETAATQNIALSDCTTPTSTVGDYKARDLEMVALIVDDPDKKVIQGDKVGYTLEFKNSGETTITGTKATFSYDPASFSLEDQGGFVQDGNGKLVLNISIFVPGESKTEQVILKVLSSVPNGTTLTTSGSIMGNETEVTLANNEKIVNINVDASNAIAEKKRVKNLTDGIESTQLKAKEGDQLRYTLSYSNIGNTILSNYTFSDIISDVLQYADLTDNGGGTEVAGTITWPVRDIQPGQTDEISFTVTVKTNVVGIGGDLKMVNAFGKEVTVVVLSNKLTYAKTGSVNGKTPSTIGVAQPGDIITYVLSATNNGTTPEQAFIFKDNISDVLSHSKVVNTNATGEAQKIIEDPSLTTAGFNISTAGVIAWSPTNIQPGAQESVKFSIKVENPLISGGDSAIQNTYENVVTEFLIEDLFISKKVKNDTKNKEGTNIKAGSGETLTYTLSIENKNAVTAFQSYTPIDDISDLIPYVNTNPIVISDSGTYNIADNKITWPATSIAAGATITRTFTVVVKQEADWPTSGDKVLTNTFGNQVDVTLFGAQDRVDLNITKEADKTSVMVSETYNYTITYQNEGNLTANSIVIVDDYPESLISVSNISNGGTAAAGVITWNITSLAGKSGPQTLTYQATVTTAVANQEIINRVSISANEVDPDQTDNQASTLVRAHEKPITVQKTINVPSVGSGTVTYNIIVENKQNTAQISNVKVTDTISTGITPTNGGSLTYVANSMTVTFEPGPNNEVGQSTGDIGTVGGVILTNIPGKRKVTISYQVAVDNTTVPQNTTSNAMNTGRIEYTTNSAQIQTAFATLVILGQGTTAPGSITVTTNEPTAGWTIQGTGSLSYTGQGLQQTYTNSPVGNYTISYNAIAGKVTPAPETKELTAGGSITFNGIYTPPSAGTGTILVNMNLANGKFTIKNDDTGQDLVTDVLGSSGTLDLQSQQYQFTYSGDTASYTITFTDVTDYTKPLTQTSSLTAGGSITFNGVYLIDQVQPKNTVFINNNIPNSVTRIECQTSGVGTISYTVIGPSGKITSVAPGPCTARWDTVVNFSAPADQTLTLVKDSNITFTGNYLAITSSSLISRTGSSGGGGGGGGGIGGGFLYSRKTGLVLTTSDITVNGKSVTNKSTVQLGYNKKYDLGFKILLENRGGLPATNIKIKISKQMNRKLIAAAMQLASNGSLAAADLKNAASGGWNIGDPFEIAGARYDREKGVLIIDNVPTNAKKIFGFKIPVRTASSGDSTFTAVITILDFGLGVSGTSDVEKRGIGETLETDFNLGKGVPRPKAPKIRPSVDLETGMLIRQTADKTFVKAGDIINLRILVDNRTGEDVHNMRIISSYGIYLEPIVVVGNDDGKELSWTRSIFKKDERAEFRYKGRVKNNFVSSTITQIITRMELDEYEPGTLPVAVTTIKHVDAYIEAPANINQPLGGTDEFAPFVEISNILPQTGAGLNASLVLAFAIMGIATALRNRKKRKFVAVSMTQE